MSRPPNARASCFTVWCLLAIVVILGVTATVELGLGRTPTYSHGPVRLWSGDTHGGQNSQQLFDPYSLTHVIHGVLFYALTRAVLGAAPVAARAVAATAIEATWELMENTDWVIDRYRSETIALDYHGDSVVNSVSDILSSLCGFLLAWRLPKRATVAGALLIEIALAFWIRDNLTLNVIMLVHRVPAIAAWQGAPR